MRLEVEHGCPLEIRALLLENLGLLEEDLFIMDGPLNPVRLMAVAEADHSPELPRTAVCRAGGAGALREEPDIFAAIRRATCLLHHPYDNFSSVMDFLRQASADPKVLAIKQTLYRTGGDLQIVGALMDAVRNGKQVTAVVELKGRSEESGNILWARRLEEAGVHVVYGLVDCKVHAKMCLVVRKDDDAIRRYLHLSTGNYNSGDRPLLRGPRPADLPPGLRRGRHQFVQFAHRHLPVSRHQKAGRGPVRVASQDAGLDRARSPARPRRNCPPASSPR